MEEYVIKLIDLTINNALKSMDRIEEEKCLNDLRIQLLCGAKSCNGGTRLAYYKYVIKLLTNLCDDFENLYKNEIKKFINDDSNK